MLCRTIVTCIFLPGIGLAEPASDNPKFDVVDQTLIYDTDRAKASIDQEIVVEDLDVFLDLLREHDGITTVQLNSTGGSIWAGREIARVVMDFELDTRVEGECSSSCTQIFLGGASRVLARGAKLGFHQSSWSSDSIKTYYENWREDEGWDTPYDFGSWLYKDTQSEVYKGLTFMISRGVDPEFAIETIRLRNTMWFPTRSELRAAGVLVD
ncbi:hypothetical protein [Tropicibacter naphthalenivorans]|uniref:Clp protease n=1 Tax=Tropicibacter naphthalenivorans TaxID=441103 RepID=A0A0P1GJZ5_9RHOB|nr:hypothetical protein [Tropicibacter naphthalenivorans]CUH82488.1 hypothetical protein TRN7648_04030 [Tropicibacter naphthalenivorans]SMD07114.1 hypothetical protein SAMN04488093_11531 [Tropicibacter naphthalenivorans]